MPASRNNPHFASAAAALLLLALLVLPPLLLHVLHQEKGHGHAGEGGGAAPAERFGAAAKPWTCAPGLSSPVRINAVGDVECMSRNARDCMWGDGGCEAKLGTAPGVIRPLDCGEGHRRAWGKRGYDAPTTHWCNRSRRFLEGGNPPRTPWTCVPGLSAPMRLNAAQDVECMSHNARDCMWGNGPCESKLATGPDRIDPLDCGEGTRREWGKRGYDEGADFWCNKAMRFLQQQQQQQQQQQMPQKPPWVPTPPAS